MQNFSRLLALSLLPLLAPAAADAAVFLEGAGGVSTVSARATTGQSSNGQSPAPVLFDFPGGTGTFEAMPANGNVFFIDPGPPETIVIGNAFADGRAGLIATTGGGTLRLTGNAYAEINANILDTGVDDPAAAADALSQTVLDVSFRLDSAATVSFFPSAFTDADGGAMSTSTVSLFSANGGPALDSSDDGQFARDVDLAAGRYFLRAEALALADVRPAPGIGGNFGFATARANPAFNVLITPVPEPAAGLLLAGGGVALLRRGRKSAG